MVMIIYENLFINCDFHLNGHLIGVSPRSGVSNLIFSLHISCEQQFISKYGLSPFSKHHRVISLSGGNCVAFAKHLNDGVCVRL